MLIHSIVWLVLLTALAVDCVEELPILQIWSQRLGSTDLPLQEVRKECNNGPIGSLRLQQDFTNNGTLLSAGFCIDNYQRFLLSGLRDQILACYMDPMCLEVNLLDEYYRGLINASCSLCKVGKCNLTSLEVLQTYAFIQMEVYCKAPQTNNTQYAILLRNQTGVVKLDKRKILKTCNTSIEVLEIIENTGCSKSLEPSMEELYQEMTNIETIEICLDDPLCEYVTLPTPESTSCPIQTNQNTSLAIKFNCTAVLREEQERECINRPSKNVPCVAIIICLAVLLATSLAFNGYSLYKKMALMRSKTQASLSNLTHRVTMPRKRETLNKYEKSIENGLDEHSYDSLGNQNSYEDVDTLKASQMSNVDSSGYLIPDCNLVAPQTSKAL